jgi:plastocyanin
MYDHQLTSLADAEKPSRPRVGWAHRAAFGVAFGIGVTIAAATAVAPSRAANATQVKIADFIFSPAAITVPVGTTVTWTNEDDIPHLVRETHSRFKSAALDTGDSYSYTFMVAGEYEYFCVLHPHMTAKVVVKD